MTKSNVDAERLESLMTLKGFKSRKSFANSLEISPLTINGLLNVVFTDPIP